MEGNAARPLGDESEHDEAAVAVREALVRRELRRIAVESGEVLLGCRELVHRHRHDVVVDVVIAVLVEVVADSGSMSEQVLHGHVVADQREVGAEQRASRCRELEHAVLDEAHDSESRQPLHPTRDCEPRVHLVPDLVAAVRETERLRQDHLVRAIDPDDAGERDLGRELVELELQRRH